MYLECDNLNKTYFNCIEKKPNKVSFIFTLLTLFYLSCLFHNPKIFRTNKEIHFKDSFGSKRR